MADAVDVTDHAVGKAPGLIRRARPADAAAILALEAIFPSDRMTIRSIRRFLRVPSASVWIAEHDGSVVGNLIWLRRAGSRAARIYSVVVAPEARGLKLAQRLIAAMEQEATRAVCATATLEVRADNTAARSLYARLGYAETRTLPGYYDDGADGLRLEKQLVSNAS